MLERSIYLNWWNNNFIYLSKTGILTGMVKKIDWSTVWRLEKRRSFILSLKLWHNYFMTRFIQPMISHPPQASKTASVSNNKFILNQPRSLQWVCSEFSVTLQWVGSDFSVSLQWLYSDFTFCSDFAVILQWVCTVFTVSLQWFCNEFIVSLQWVCSDFAVNL